MDIPETFHTFEVDGEILVTPGIAVGNKCWQRKAHRWLRSMHVRADDLSIISCGFPKFMNMGEGVGDYKVTREAILSRVGKDDSLCATLKIDGSMLVRFVQDGKVRFRTRGWLGVKNGSDEIADFCADNPTLLDPGFAPDDSLLFEWTSPKRQVVLRYDKPGLTLIGGVRHKRVRWDEADITLYSPDEVLAAAATGGFKCTEFVPIRSRDDFENLLLSLKNNPRIEGYVIRVDGGQRMAKVKTQNYLTLHALKEGVTSARLVRLWTEWERPSFQGYREMFLRYFDWECWQASMPGVSSMFRGVQDAEAAIAHVERFVAERRGANRGGFAREAQERFQKRHMQIIFALFDGKPVPDEAWQKLVLQNCKQVETEFPTGEISA